MNPAPTKETASARLKLAQAKRHLGSVTAAFEQLLDGVVMPVRGVYVKDASEYHFLCDATLDPPEEISLYVGDALHNTFAALDHLVWGLAGQDAGRHTGFPICDSEPAFRKALGQLDGVDQRFQGFIESAQPYKQVSLFAPLAMKNPPAEPHPLQVLKALENVDKHRVLHTTAAVFDNATYGLSKNADVSGHEVPDVTFCPLRAGEVLARVKLVASGPNPIIELDGRLSPSLAFDVHAAESGVGYEATLKALDQRDVIERLSGLHEYVSEIVDAIDESLVSGGPPQRRRPKDVEVMFDELWSARRYVRVFSAAPRVDQSTNGEVSR